MVYEHPDPMARLAMIRDHMAKESAKMPVVDHNGYPIAPEPVVEEIADPAVEVPAGPRTPAPDYSQGGGSSPIGDTYRTKLARAKQTGDLMTQMSLANRPIVEGRNLGISPQQWLARYGDLPA